MTNAKQISKTAGFLILTGMVAGVFSVVPSVESDHFLSQVAIHRVEVMVGAVFQFMLVPIYAVFSLLMYSMLKQYNNALSVGFLGFRLMAIAFQVVGIIALPILVILSQNYTDVAHNDATTYELIGGLVKLSRDLINHFGVIVATGLGNLLFYKMLINERLLPKWLSLWGVGGNLLIIVAGFLLLFELIDVVSIEYGFMSIPLVLQEVVLAIWLIVMGVGEMKKKILL